MYFGFATIFILLAGIQVWFLRSYFFNGDFYFLALGRFWETPGKIFFTDIWQGIWYRPLGLLSMVINYWIVGLNPLGYHAIDLALHFLNSLIVISLVSLLFNDRKKGIVAGACFAVHPICIQTSIWLSSRFDVMGSAFYLMALWCFAKFNSEKKKRLYICSVFLTASSFLCKETMITLPLLIVAFDLYFGEKRNWINRVKIYLPFFLLSVIFLMLRWYVLGGWGGYENQKTSLSSFFPQIYYHLPRLFYHVFYKMIYSNYEIMGKWSNLIFSGFALIFFLFLIMSFKDKRLNKIKAFSFGLIWIFISIIPLSTSSHLIMVEGDRYLYLSMVGFCILIMSLLEEDNVKKKISIGIFALLIGVYSLISVKESIIWKERCGENKKIVSTIENIIQKDPSRFPPGSIFYFLGLQDHPYCFDIMFKLVLSEFFHRYYFILGDQPTFVWRFRAIEESAGLEKYLSLKKTVFFKDEKNSIESVEPPDLLNTAIVDKDAYFFQYLSRGRFKEITRVIKALAQKREELQQKEEHNKVLAWNFSKKGEFRQWKIANQLILSHNKKEINKSPPRLKSTGDDPYMIGPEIRIPSLTLEMIEIRMKLSRRRYLPPPEKYGMILWINEYDPTWAGEKQISFPVIADGEFHTYQIPVEKNIYWQMSGVITHLRIDPVCFPTEIQIDYIRLIPNIQ
ncbi:MAG: glycosyltransferase family 39 protein [Deltaproteobacteria bacterium]|nr:MAG: glycosyltransferase family 39 protein [Deltaproteobacteria bacterium]